MKEIIYFFLHRWLRLIGGLLVFTSLGLLVFLIFLDLIAGISNPYVGIITYVILPGMLFLGLILTPLDSYLRHRREAAGQPVEVLSFSIDFRNRRQRALAYFFASASMIILIVATVATYKGVEFMDTRTFCGLTCHRVMVPEYTAYRRSPHAGVPCIQCHIGPGAPWFVKAKISGIPQVYHYTTNTYERPIPTPVAALRPSRDTCENCHWPEQFYGDALRTRITYLPDRANSMRKTTMLMRVGSGAVKGANIHSHIVQKVWYLPANERRTEIAWVRVRRVDGTTGEYVLPRLRDDLKEIRARAEVRFMDCIDCHNRAAHNFQSFDRLLDLAMTKGALDRSIPYLKREALTAAPEQAGAPTESEQKAALDRIAAIPEVYKRNYPDVYKERERDIAAAVAKIRGVYLTSSFPHMRISPDTYPNWATHEGCFRCHGALVRLSGKAKEKLDNDCLLCHTLPERSVQNKP